MRLPPRQILDSALSIDERFFRTGHLTGAPRECIDQIKEWKMPEPGSYAAKGVFALQ